MKARGRGRSGTILMFGFERRSFKRECVLEIERLIFGDSASSIAPKTFGV